MTDERAEQMYQELMSTGRLGPDQARAGVEIAVARARAWAAQTGKTPEEYFQRRGIRFVGGDPEALRYGAAAQGEVYTQLNPDVDPEEEVSVVNLDGVAPLKITSGGVKQFLTLFDGVELEARRGEGKSSWKAGLYRKDKDHPVWSSRKGPAQYARGRRAGLTALDQVLKGAVLVESFQNQKADPKKKNWGVVHRFYTPVEIGGRVSLLRVVAVEEKGKPAQVEGVQVYDVMQEKPAQGGKPNKAAGTSPQAGKLKIKHMLAGVKDSAWNEYFPGPNQVLNQSAYHQDKKKFPRAAVEFMDHSALVHIFSKGDVTSVAHELGHIRLKDFLDDISMNDASPAMLKDWATLKQWLGVSEEQGLKLTEAQHEKFARGIEAYLGEGKAPSMSLQRAFAQFRRWVLSVYKTLVNLKAPLNDDVRGVFDRLLATEEEISEMRHREEMAGLWSEADQIMARSTSSLPMTPTSVPPATTGRV